MTEADHIIVHFTEPQDTGHRFRRSRTEWPLHITLVPWFSVPDLGSLAVGLSEAAQAIGKFDITVGKDKHYGPNADIAVNVIRDWPLVKTVHDGLLQAVRASGCIIADDQWCGYKFAPHITHHGDQRYYEGDELTFGDFHVVRALPDRMCEVGERYLLGDGQA